MVLRWAALCCAVVVCVQRVVPGAPTSGRAVALKLLMDQLIMAPAGTALFFFGFKVRVHVQPHSASSMDAAAWMPIVGPRAALPLQPAWQCHIWR